MPHAPRSVAIPHLLSFDSFALPWVTWYQVEPSYNARMVILYSLCGMKSNHGWKLEKMGDKMPENGQKLGFRALFPILGHLCPMSPILHPFFRFRPETRNRSRPKNRNKIVQKKPKLKPTVYFNALEVRQSLEEKNPCIFGVAFPCLLLHAAESKEKKIKELRLTANERWTPASVAATPPVARHLFRGSLTSDTPGSSRATGATEPFRGGVVRYCCYTWKTPGPLSGEGGLWDTGVLQIDLSLEKD